MNTIKIRKEHSELIERIRTNVRAYLDFQVEGADIMNAPSQVLDSSPAVTYHNFLKKCFEDDIKELNELMKIENE